MAAGHEAQRERGRRRQTCHGWATVHRRDHRSESGLTSRGCRSTADRIVGRRITGAATLDRVPAVPGPRPLRHLRPRAVLRDPLRLLRLQHLHAGRAGRSGASPDGWLAAVRRSSRLARAVVGGRRRWTRCSSAAGRRRCSGPRGSRVLDAVRDDFGLAPGAEVTTEANPESTSPEFFARLRAAGFTRVSLGMQSVAPHVLAVLDRRHTPGPGGRGGRRGAGGGLRRTSTSTSSTARRGRPTTTCAASLDAALDAGVDHVSAYALIVEDGTRAGAAGAPRGDAGARRRRARRPLRADRRAAVGGRVCAGTRCRTGRLGRTRECRHNLGYWHGGDWWGAGPGAHSHVGRERAGGTSSTRRAYAALLAAGSSPEAGREELTDAERRDRAGDAAAAAGVGAAARDLLDARRRGRGDPRGRATACSTPRALDRGPGRADPPRPPARRRRGARSSCRRPRPQPRPDARVGPDARMCARYARVATLGGANVPSGTRESPRSGARKALLSAAAPPSPGYRLRCFAARGVATRRCGVG